MAVSLGDPDSGAEDSAPGFFCVAVADAPTNLLASPRIVNRAFGFAMNNPICIW
jgi:hypothetical protein